MAVDFFVRQEGGKINPPTLIVGVIEAVDVVIWLTYIPTKSCRDLVALRLLKG